MTRPVHLPRSASHDLFHYGRCISTHSRAIRSTQISKKYQIGARKLAHDGLRFLARGPSARQFDAFLVREEPIAEAQMKEIARHDQTRSFAKISKPRFVPLRQMHINALASNSVNANQQKIPDRSSKARSRRPALPGARPIGSPIRRLPRQGGADRRSSDERNSAA